MRKLKDTLFVVGMFLLSFAIVAFVFFIAYVKFMAYYKLAFDLVGRKYKLFLETFFAKDLQD